MKTHSTKPDKLTKRCERCEEKFELPNLKECRARDILIQYYPCPHCLYVKDIHNAKFNNSGRCRDCAIPFKLMKHQAKGRCNRCYMRNLRHKQQGM